MNVYAIYVGHTNGTVTIKASNNGLTEVTAAGDAICVESGTLTIKDGKFTCGTEDSKQVLYKTGGTITPISAGAFSKEIDTTYLATGYGLEQEDDHYWHVRQHLVKIYQAIELHDSFGINMYVEPLMTEDLSKYEVSYQFGSAAGTGPVPLTSGTLISGSAGQFYKFTPADCLATQMADKVLFKVWYDGTVVATLEDCSIRSYCKSAIEAAANPEANERDQKLAQLCISVLDYGASSQQHFNYNTGDLANKDHNDLNNLVAVPANWTPVPNGSNENVDAIYTALELNSRMELNIYLIPASGKTIDPATISVSKRVGDGASAWPMNQVTITDVGKYVKVKIKGITSLDLQSMFRMSLPNLTFDYSPMSYAQSEQTASDTMRQLCRTLYKYAVAATNYEPYLGQ